MQGIPLGAASSVSDARPGRTGFRQLKYDMRVKLAGQSLYGLQALVWRKVRAPQSRMPANGRAP